MADHVCGAGGIGLHSCAVGDPQVQTQPGTQAQVIEVKNSSCMLKILCVRLMLMAVNKCCDDVNVVLLVCWNEQPMSVLFRPTRYWGPALPRHRRLMGRYLRADQFEVDPWSRDILSGHVQVSSKVIHSAGHFVRKWTGELEDQVHPVRRCTRECDNHHGSNV